MARCARVGVSFRFCCAEVCWEGRRKPWNEADSSVKIQKTFSLLVAFGHFFAGMPARKLVKSKKCLQVKKTFSSFVAFGHFLPNWIKTDIK
jgi:hypothetical protein